MTVTILNYEILKKEYKRKRAQDQKIERQKKTLEAQKTKILNSSEIESLLEKFKLVE